MPHLINQSKEFEAHVSRMKTQYEQIRLLKEKLPLHHVVIHMDFDTNLEDENRFMYNVSFMEKREKMFQWPRNKDIIWCKNTDIKFKLSTGKSERMYKLESAEWVKILNFDNM